MSIKTSNHVIMDAYNKGLIPSAIYTLDKNKNPQMKDLGWLPKASFDTSDGSVNYLKNFSHVKSIIKSADNFRTVFTPDGEFNSHSEVAENYAISLAMEEKYDASLKLFEAITANTKTIDTVIQSSNKLLPVVNMPGLLGFEGIFQYANACYEVGSRDDSKRSKELLIKSRDLYQFIADLDRHYHGGLRFCEIKKESLHALVNDFKMNGYQYLLDLTSVITN